MTSKMRWLTWTVFGILYFLTVGSAFAHESPVGHIHSHGGSAIPVTPVLVAAFFALDFAAFVVWRRFSKRSS